LKVLTFRKTIPAALFFSGLFTYLCADCFPPDSLSNEMYFSTQLSTVVNGTITIDEPCLVSIISSFKSEKKEDVENLRLILEKYCTHNAFKWNSLLFCGFDNRIVYNNKTLWSAIKKGWSKKNRSPHQAFISLVNDGFPAQADTLYTIFDKDTILDKYDLTRWANVKNVTGDYLKIPDLFCRSLQLSEFRFIEMSLMQFSEMLNEISPEIVDTMVQLFADNCFPNLKLADNEKSVVFSWIIETWGLLNNHRKQIQFIRKNVPEKDAGELMYQVSEKYFARKNYIAAASVASLAYQNATEKKLRQQAAGVAFQSWVALNRSDSIAVWIERAGLDNTISKTEGIVLYQNQGEFDKSKQLIENLPRSLARDTMAIRQSLFMKENENVSFSILEKSAFLKDEPVLQEIWKLRLMLFNKKLAAFQNLVDSLRAFPEWSMFPEMLKYRYWVQKCGGKEDMLTAWAMIEYYNFIGKPENSSELLCPGVITEPDRSLLVREVAQALLQRSAKDAMKFFNACFKDTLSDPGITYCRAEANLLTGNQNEAQRLLQSIILNYPKDVYSGKARVLLMKITKGR
jgi:hypothetical protein